MCLVAIDARGLAQAGKAACRFEERSLCLSVAAVALGAGSCGNPGAEGAPHTQGWGWAGAGCRIPLPNVCDDDRALFPWGIPPWDGSSFCS